MKSLYRTLCRMSYATHVAKIIVNIARTLRNNRIQIAQIGERLDTDSERPPIANSSSIDKSTLI
jgi:hypothetical protein